MNRHQRHSDGRLLRRGCADQGSATVELVVLIPVLLLEFLFVVYCVRLPDTRLRIEDAAHQASRAASQERDPAAAASQARTTAAAALKDAGISCQSFTADTNGTLRPGSTVTVTLSCTVGLQDLALIQVPGSTALRAQSAAQVDVHRGTAPGTATTPPADRTPEAP